MVANASLEYSYKEEHDQHQHNHHEELDHYGGMHDLEKLHGHHDDHGHYHQNSEQANHGTSKGSRKQRARHRTKAVDAFREAHKSHAAALEKQRKYLERTKHQSTLSKNQRKKMRKLEAEVAKHSESMKEHKETFMQNHGGTEHEKNAAWLSHTGQHRR